MKPRIFSTLALGLALAIQSLTQPAPALQPTATSTISSSSADAWWKHAVFYEIYPRSFADANNNGIGNIPGITSKIDYLKSLGVDAIWITPCYPSPQVDFGYDISDYRNISPEYGTLADFDNLMAQANKRKIKIIMDLVMNHTSNKHPWFVESSSSKINPKRDWYIWKDGKNGGPPNNWESVFGHSAWTLDPKTNQYYYHFFYAQQPDLNWRNPQVRKAMYDVARFWLNRGVAGFRLDAITTLFEDPKLHDNPIDDGKKNQFGDPVMDNKYNDHLPEVHEVLKELRHVLDSYPGHRVLIGETGGKDIAELSRMYGKNLDEVQLPMNFFFADVNKLSATEFRKQIAAWNNNPADGWPLYLFSNHDQVRHYIRYGNGKNNDDIAKLTAAMLMTLRGTPIMYYGEEIGMENNDPKRVEDVKDPIGKIGWPKEKGRDGERTPMQWNSSRNAGFSEKQPWLPVADNYKTHNVAVESSDSSSILSFYKALIKLRKTNSALLTGKYIPLNESDKNVLSYLRKGPQTSVFVALNMSGSPTQVSFNLSPYDIQSKQSRTLLASNYKTGTTKSLKRLTLFPYSVYIGEVR